MAYSLIEAVIRSTDLSFSMPLLLVRMILLPLLHKLLIHMLPEKSHYLHWGRHGQSGFDQSDQRIQGRQDDAITREVLNEQVVHIL